MREVVKVSISGIAFTFDCDAYRIMKEYIDKLENGYSKKPEGREVVADIEARIAELILNEQESDRVVSRELTGSVIMQLGFPDDMDESEEQPVEKIPKRLHRNREGAVLGGVCSGLGAYFHVDPVWIRLAFFLPLLLVILVGTFNGGSHAAGFFGSMFGMFVIVYIIFWIAIPMARTPRQKLEMRGEKVTASTIRQTFAEEGPAMPPSAKRRRSASVWADIVYGLGHIVLFALKMIVFFIALAVGIAVIASIVAIVAVILGEEIIGGRMLLDAFSGMEGITPGLYAALLILAAFIPMLILGYLLLKVLFGARTNRTFLLIAGVIWIILIVYLSVVTMHNADNLREGARRFGYGIENYEDCVSGTQLHILPDGAANSREYLQELYDEDFEEDWQDDNVYVGITGTGDGSVTISKTVLSTVNPADTLSNERIVISRGSR